MRIGHHRYPLVYPNLIKMRFQAPTMGVLYIYIYIYSFIMSVRGHQRPYCMMVSVLHRVAQRMNIIDIYIDISRDVATTGEKIKLNDVAPDNNRSIYVNIYICRCQYRSMSI
jgi:hypothetical protein